MHYAFADQTFERFTCDACNVHRIAKANIEMCPLTSARLNQKYNPNDRSIEYCVELSIHFLPYAMHLQIYQKRDQS